MNTITILNQEKVIKLEGVIQLTQFLELFLTLKFFIDEEFEKPVFESELSRGRLVTLIEQAGGNVTKSIFDKKTNPLS